MNRDSTAAADEDTITSNSASTGIFVFIALIWSVPLAESSAESQSVSGEAIQFGYTQPNRKDQ
jgi:hypothetical protein